MTSTDEPSTNQINHWANRTAGWSAGASDGKPTDDTFDKALIDAAEIIPAMNVLDLAAGSGDPTISIAQHMNNTGTVTALDMTYGMLNMARSRSENLTLGSVCLVNANMEALPFPASTFDAVTCRNGLMFPENRYACVSESCRILRPGAKGAFLVWSKIEDNPTFLTVIEGLKNYFKEDFKPRMVRHALGAEGALADLLSSGGYQKVEERRFAYVRTVPMGDDYFRRAAARTIPERAANLSKDQWSDLLAAIEEASTALLDGDNFRIPIVARLAVATAPS